MKKISRNSKFFKTVIHSITEKKGLQITALDVSKIPESICDYFIICTANNHNQIRAIADFIEEEIYIKCDTKPYHIEGIQDGQWGILDYVDVVIHVMLEDHRNFYQIEQLWHDAVRYDF